MSAADRPIPLRVLLIEDVEDDALLLLAELRRGGYAPDGTRVDAPAALEAALATGGWDVVLADYALPGWSALAALAAVRRRDPDLPFLIVSGVVDEEGAVTALKAGAHDYLPKDRLTRLVPAVGREVREAAGRRARRRAEAALRASEARYRAVVDNAGDAIVIVEADGRLASCNRGAERIFGYAAGELVGRSLAWLLPAHPAVGLAPPLGGPHEVTGRRRDGTALPLELTLAEVASAPERLFVGILRDISERRSLEERLRHQATHDPLTGLPNRALLLDRLALALHRAARRPGMVAVLFLDLDRFKTVNDSLGHEAGDRLLVALAGRLVAVVRPADTVARRGGDEFTLLLEDLGGEAEAVAVAERVLADLRTPFTVDGQELVVGASVGIALAGGGEGDPAAPAALLHAADLALYRAKAAGRGRHALFSPELRARATARLALEQDLRRALEGGEVVVHYQPEVDLATGRLVGVEALARWRHPQRGLLPPAEFIALAEETGLIVPLGRQVLAAACRQARAWQQALPRDPPLLICVNLSPRQFAHPDLVGDVRRALGASGLARGSLGLEITESVAMGAAEATLATLRALKALGVTLELDDFGTGYSSLAYLQRFPLDRLKLDRSFVRGLGRDPGSGAIVRAVLTLARALGLGVTAEGVETTAQATMLRELGCDLGQGYLFAPPLPADELEARLLCQW